MRGAENLEADEIEEGVGNVSQGALQSCPSI